MPLVPPPLDRGLPSLRVMGIPGDDHEVTYIPVGLGWVDPSGARPGPVDKVSVGGVVVVSGRLSLLADPEDVRALQERAEQRFGTGVAVTARRPGAAHLWILDGATVLWSRSVPGPSFERIPVQFTVPAGSRVLTGEATGIALVAHETRDHDPRDHVKRWVFHFQETALREGG